MSVYYDGRDIKMHVGYIDGTTAIKLHDALPASGVIPLYLRVVRSGNSWTYSYSQDGSSWFVAKTFTRVLNVSEVGFFATSSRPYPGNTASVDYFMDLNDPINDNDSSSPTPPQVDIWYGDTQSFGSLGTPQRWINVLGRAWDINGIASVSYSLNGGAPVSLKVGADGKRLQDNGDFNIELDRYEIPTGTNTIVVTAVDLLGATKNETVTVENATDSVWPIPYSVDWSSVTAINEVAEVLDGLWEMTPSGVRTVDSGYDRLIALGDESWSAVSEATVSFTIHSGKANSGIGIALGWQGHTGGGSPKVDWPLEAIGWLRDVPGDPELHIMTYEDGIQVKEDRPEIALGTSYTLKVRTEPIGNGKTKFHVKIWSSSASEPTGWDLSAEVPRRNGSLLMIAHNADVTWENTSVSAGGNAVPVFTSSPVTSALENQAYQYDVTTSDADDTNLDITAPTLPGWLTFVDNNDGTATLSGIPDNGDVGNHDVVLRVSDSEDQSTQSFTIAVAAEPGGDPPPENEPPVFTSSPVTSALENEAYQYDVTTSDPDDTNLDITAPTLPGWLTFVDNNDGTATLSGTPGTGDIGDHDVVLQVSDFEDQSTQSFIVTVLAVGNEPPVFTSSPVTSAVENEAYQYDVTTSDPDDTNLDITAPTLPDWLTFVDNNDGTATLSGTPGSGDIGDHDVVLQVSDSEDQSTQSFTVSVNAAGTSELFTDDFTDSNLDSRWRFFDPVGDVTLNLTGNEVQFDIPAGADHNLWKQNLNKSPRLLQPTSDTDMTLEAKFASTPSVKFQLQGLIVHEDDDTFLRIGTYHDGKKIRFFIAFINGGSASVIMNKNAPRNTVPSYLKAERVGNVWTCSYSTNGSNWKVYRTFTQSLNVAEVGFYGGNAGANPAFITSVDYFSGMNETEAMGPIAQSSAMDTNMGLMSASNPIPEEHALNQNYPNPFNPQTTIAFALSENANVNLVVYDMLGRQVSVLVSGSREAGNHEVTFDASHLPSGMYIYRLDLPGKSLTRKMILSK